MQEDALILHLAAEIINMRQYAKGSKESILKKYQRYGADDSVYAKAEKIANTVWAAGIDALTS